MRQIDFYATETNYFDHIKPVWEALPNENRGTFYVAPPMADYALMRMRTTEFVPYTKNLQMDCCNPVLVAAYGNMLNVNKVHPTKKIVMMEHGTGHTFGTAPYPNGAGKRDIVDLFLPPNEYTARKIRSARSTPLQVIGTPKLDSIVKEVNPSMGIKRYSPEELTIAIGFHWGTAKNKPPESGSAFEYYKSYLKELSKHHNLIAYGHPLAARTYRPFYESIKVPYVEDFFDVMRIADICINDLSSVVYEYLVTGKPVILLNAPWFRRNVTHGIRFWDYADIGINVNSPEELEVAIFSTSTHYADSNASERLVAVRDLYPYLGQAAKRAAEVLVDYLKE